ncbi:MAG: hypothetical protein WD801_01535 [Gemmatimonadaceae bacterium]
MQRPLGVTLSAVVAIIGSALALLFAAIVAVSTATGTGDMAAYGGPVVFMALLSAAAGVTGLFTAVGLLRLRPWARTSMLVFAGIVAVFSLAGGTVMAVLPLPPTPGMTDATMQTVRRVALVAYGVPLAICVWWLVQFNRQATKDAFAAAAPGEVTRRPLIISIIGWFNIIGGVFLISAAMTSMPALAAGFVLTGWSASILYLFLGAVNTYLGWRLLRLDEHARILTIWWFVLTITHTMFMALTPSARARMRDVQVLLRPEGAPPPPEMTTSATITMMAVSALLLAAAIWPLVACKPAFTLDDDETTTP